MYLEQAALDRFKFIGKHVARIYCELSRAAFGKEKTWKMQANLHLFIHLLEWQTQETKLNPKACWTYGDEDLVGQLIDISEACHVGTIATATMSKWVLSVLGVLDD